MTLHLIDTWVWDSWFAVDGDLVHAFYLQAPRSIGDPEARHWRASVGHATSTDLRSWNVQPDALEPGAAGGFDDLAIWTGSVARIDDRWLMAYTGLNRSEGGRVQRIGFAASEDLTSWARTGPVIEADPTWYERSDGVRHEHWRDPWLWFDVSGRANLYVTARANTGPSDGRGVIGHVVSGDLVDWQCRPPVSAPGAFSQLEVPQLVELDAGTWIVLFSARREDHSAVHRSTASVAATSGTHYLRGPAATGPFAVAPGPFLLGGLANERYAARLVRWQGQSWLMTWIDRPGGTFVGDLADPIPFVFGPDGAPRLATPGATDHDGD